MHAEVAILMLQLLSKAACSVIFEWYNQAANQTGVPIDDLKIDPELTELNIPAHYFKCK